MKMISAPLSASARASSGTYTSLQTSIPTFASPTWNTGRSSAAWYPKSQNLPPS
jgi:hypothetical protein